MVVAAAGMTGIYVSEQTNRNEQYEQKAEPDGEKYVTEEETEVEPAEDVSNILLPEVSEPQTEQVMPSVETDVETESVEEEAEATVPTGELRTALAASGKCDHELQYGSDRLLRDARFLSLQSGGHHCR